MIDCATGATVYNQELDPAVVPLLHDEAKAAGMEILTYQGEGIAATKKANKYVLHEAFINKMPVEEYTDFKNQIEFPINKCLIVGDPKPLHQLELRLASQMEGKLSV